MEMPIVTKVKVIPPYSLEVTFQDGKHRTVNMEPELWGEVLEPLKDPAFFAKAFVDEELGTVCWPNGADIAPDRLYEPDPVKWQKLGDESDAAGKQRKPRKRQNARI